jgi:glycosyltransferase involved in cell wall biosynthesis
MNPESGPKTSPPQKRRFAIVIPVYNHGTSVEWVISRTKGLGADIIVVNDGSTDDTAARLGRISDISVITHARNAGKGAALQTGLTEAAQLADYAVTIDADGQHDPADAPALMAAATDSGSALIVGCRTGMEQSHIRYGSRMGRRFSNFWVWVCGGPKLSDSQSGFRAYPLPGALHWGAVCNRFDFEVEILVRARRHGVAVIEVPVNVHYLPADQRISHFRPGLDFLRNAGIFTRLLGQRFVGFLRKSTRSGSH